MSTTCRNNRQEETKNVELTFLRSELLYDIGNIAYVEGDTMRTEDVHIPHQTFDITQKGNVDIVTRSLNLAFAEVTEALNPFTRQDLVCGTVKDDILQEPFDYVVDLQLPTTFSQTTVDYLEHLIHDYLVIRALVDFLGITYPERLPHWQARLEKVKDDIQVCKSTRSKGLRRTLRPW